MKAITSNATLRRLRVFLPKRPKILKELATMTVNMRPIMTRSPVAPTSLKYEMNA